MRIRRLTVFVLAALVVSWASYLEANSTQSVMEERFRDFSRGEWENLSLHHRGVLQLSPEARKIASLNEPIIWSTVVAPDGTVFFGSGNAGKVFRMAPGGDPEEWFNPDEVITRGIALDGDGNLYAATSPDGKVYRIDPEGVSTVFFKPEDSYIWDLIFDPEGHLYVATGSNARIYRLPPGFDEEGGDKAEVYFDSSEEHISTLAWDHQGRLLAGSTPNGYLYRIAGAGDGFVVFNSGEDEVKSIAVAEDGTIYASTYSSTATGAGTPMASVRATGDREDGAERIRLSGRRGTSSVIYRIQPDGFGTVFWRNNQVPVHSMQIGVDGALLVGTAFKGSLFSIRGPQEWELLQSVETGGEISRLEWAGEGKSSLLAFTSNPARVFEMDYTRAVEGSFTSDVHDARHPAHWGRIHVDVLRDNPGSVLVQTRSGNTEDPENTWSPWTEPVPAARSIAIESPTARYFQYRLLFSNNNGGREGSPGVTQVRYFFRNINVPPTVESVRVISRDIGVEKLPPAPQPPTVDLEQLFRETPRPQPEQRSQARVFERPGLATIAWRANDPNGDTLSYTVRLRRVDQTSWMTLAEDLRDPFYSFDTQGYEEGFYVAKIIASDYLSNPPGEALNSSETSEPFLIDNTPPVLTLQSVEVTGRRAVVHLTAEDSVSIIQSATYSHNGGSPQPVFPADRLFDSMREDFRIELDHLSPGEHQVTVRVFDEANNSRVLNVSFRIRD